MGLEPMPYTSVALMGQYQNVRQRKWGTNIIRTVHILQHDSAQEEFYHDQLKLLPINLARQ